MQTTGHLIIQGEKVLVLVRSRKYGVALKVRKSGGVGRYFPDESFHLNENPELTKDLLSGKTIRI